MNHPFDKQITRIFKKGSYSDLPPAISLYDLLVKMNSQQEEKMNIMLTIQTIFNKCRRKSCQKPTQKHMLDNRGYCPECAKVIRPYRSTGKRETK